ncbi:MAG: restriction endonuclease subunit S [Acidithiobacillus sp.]
MSGESFLDKLLDGAGAEWKRLGDVVRIKNGKDHKTLGDGAFPVYGSGGIMRYADTYAYNKPSVLIPRKGTLANLFFVDTPFWNVDTIFYTEIDEAQIRPKFLYYFLTTLGLGEMNQAGGVPSQTQSVLNELKIPIPCPENPKKSLAIQAEIVRILDTFTELTAELTAELTTRKKQYNHYRDQLLRFEEGEVEWKTLGEITTSIASGRNKTRTTDGVIPVYGSTGPIGFTNEATYSGDVLLVARVGANAGLVNAVSGDFDVSDNTLVIRSMDAWNIRFAFHQLTHMNLNQYAVGGGQPLVTGGLLKSLKVPFPPLKEQRRVATILDKFDALTTSLTEGLPREIELRQKQYEYYRDLLLSFPKDAPHA